MDLMEVSNFFISFSASDLSFFSFVFFSGFFELILFPIDKKINNARLNLAENTNHTIEFPILLSIFANDDNLWLQKVQ